MGNDIGSFFSGAIQSLEQNIEGGVEGMFKSNSSGTTAAGEAHGSNSLGGFDIGALFNMGNNGIMGELFAKVGGNELGIIGGLFQGNTNKSQQGNGYAPPPPCGTYVPPPPPGNTGAGVSPHRDGPDGTAGTQNTGGAQVAGTNGTSSLAGTADPRLPDAIAALETLMMNFNKCSSNGQMTPASLQQAAWDPSNPQLQQAAKFFTSNPDLMAQLFRQGGVNSGTASFDQLNTLDSIWTSVQKTNGPGTTTHSTPVATVATTGTGSTASGNTNYADMISQLQQQIAKLQQQLLASGSGGSASWESPPSINPNMTTGGSGDLTTTAKTSSTAGSGFTKAENSLDAGFDKLQDKLANDMNDAMSDDPKTAFRGQQAVAKDQQQISAIMQMQNQLSQMMSDISKAYNDMAMTAIRNMNG